MGANGSTGSASQATESPEGDQVDSDNDLLEIGTFGSPHGVRGNIRLFPTTDCADERLKQSGVRCDHDINPKQSKQKYIRSHQGKTSRLSRCIC